MAKQVNKGAADAAARLIAKYGKSAVSSAVRSFKPTKKVKIEKTIARATKEPKSNVKVVKKTSNAKKDWYNYESRRRAYDRALNDAWETEGSFANYEAEGYVKEMTGRNFKKKVNKAAPVKSKAIRKQDYKRNQIIKKKK